MVDEKRWLTEYDTAEGAAHVGPIIRADCQAFAQAIAHTLLLGPTGQPLRVVGELLEQTDVDSDAVTSLVRRVV